MPNASDPHTQSEAQHVSGLTPEPFTAATDSIQLASAEFPPFGIQKLPEFAGDESGNSLPGPRRALAQALAYLNKGIAVVPQVPATKKAYVRWKPYQDRLPTEEEVERWYGDHPDAGIAAVLGPVSDLIVIDVDGEEAHRALLSRLGTEPAAPKVMSGSGEPYRYHLFFRHPDLATRAKATPWHPKLEFRGKGGLIVLSPSLHKSGNEYRWAEGRSLDNLPPPELPLPVLEALREEARKRQTTDRLPSGLTTGDMLDEALGRARRYLARMPAAVEGDGGDLTTFTAACRLVIGFGLSPEQALPLLLEYNLRCRPPWEEQDLVHKLREADKQPGSRGGLLRERKAAVLAEAELTNQSSAKKSGVPFCGPVPDFVQADHQRARARAWMDPASVKHRRRKARLANALYWSVHLAVLFQGRSTVVIPDVLFRQAFWGLQGHPRNWRRRLLHALVDKDRLTGHAIRSAHIAEESDAGYECPSRCAMHGSGVRHRHFLVKIVVPEPDDGPDRCLPVTSRFGNTFLGCLEIYGIDSGIGERDYPWDPTPGPNPNPNENPDETEEENSDRENEELRQAAIKKYRQVGEMVSVYFPMLLFGLSPRLGLSYRQVQLHKAVTRELTRNAGKRKAERPDNAELLDATRARVAKAVVSPDVPWHLLPEGRFVGFNGNGKGRRRGYHGRGYRLVTWMRRSGHIAAPNPSDPAPSEQDELPGPDFITAAKRFVKDLERLAEEFGLVAAGWNPDRREWLELNQLSALLRTDRGIRWLLRCRLRIYTGEDYPARWRDWIAARMGFGFIPGGPE